NTITRDHVIRRELAIHPTDLSNKLLIDKSKNRLLGLGYFKTVDISPVDTGIEGEKDLLLKVEENETGRMSFGAGVSSASSFVGTVGLHQSYFDAGAGWPYRGGGQKMKASLEAGGSRNRIEVTFIEPWLNNKPMSLATTLSHATRYYDEYDEQHTGISLSLTSRIQSGALNNWRFTRGFRLESVDVEVEDDVSAVLRAEETSDFVTAMFFNISKDTRNRVRRPTKGGRLSLMTDFQTEALGSENNIYKLRLTASEYISVFEESVIKFRGELGVVDALSGDVPIYERFFAGGLNSLRGYKHRKVGPADINKDELGGSSTLLGTVELDVPLFKKVNGALFMDVGNVWESAYGWDPSDINVTLGLGVRVDLPIGTLQLDYGKPVINNNVNGGGGRIHFNFGYQF
ncbi:MAG: BamA/TamA family outer membrane protein, partial [Lentisphaeraceae bacterium]|nr:BamA/TamA family outer membrane protein [Lentisphaeraceae bacterium]